MSHQIETSADRLLEIVKEKKEISLKEACRELNVSRDVVRTWAEVLEESKLLFIEQKLNEMYIRSLDYRQHKNPIKSLMNDIKSVGTLGFLETELSSREELINQKIKELDMKLKEIRRFEKVKKEALLLQDKNKKMEKDLIGVKSILEKREKDILKKEKEVLRREDDLSKKLSEMKELSIKFSEKELSISMKEKEVRQVLDALLKQRKHADRMRESMDARSDKIKLAETEIESMKQDLEIELDAASKQRDSFSKMKSDLEKRQEAIYKIAEDLMLKKRHYEQRMKELEIKRVEVDAVMREAEDYKRIIYDQVQSLDNLPRNISYDGSFSDNSKEEADA